MKEKMHKMPNGMMMSDKEMKKMMGKKMPAKKSSKKK
jgi:hypothetical protein